MARKKKEQAQTDIPGMEPINEGAAQSSEPELSQITATDTVSGLSADPGPIRTPQPKLVVPELETGGIDLESMRPKTVDRLKNMIRLTPDLFAEAKTAAGPVELDGGAIDMIHTGICKLVGYGAAFQFPKQLCDQIFNMSPEELKLLREPTSDFVKRHFGDKLQKLGPDFAFYMALGQVYVSKFAMLVLISRQQNAQTETPKAA